MSTVLLRWPLFALFALVVGCNGGGANSPNRITTFSNFQAARLVVGQKNGGDCGVQNPPAADTVNMPFGRALVSGGRLYLPDSGNNRVMVYTSMPVDNGGGANLMLGQSSFDSNGGGNGKAQVRAARTATVGGGRLIVTDTYNHRILIYNSEPTTSGAEADVVIGWDDFSQPVASGECGQNRLRYPASVYFVNGKLLVADEDNHRVLIWNSIPTQSGTRADLVLGQSSFDSCAINGGRVADGATLRSPTDVWSDGVRVVIADSQNNRVLVWKSFPITNGAPADLVVGQPDFSRVAGGDLSVNLLRPSSVWSSGNQLFVADRGNNRVVLWNAFPVVNGAPADVVLGQQYFSKSAANDDDQNDISDPSPTSRTLSAPSGVALWGNQLFVTDGGNNRYLVFEGK